MPLPRVARPLLALTSLLAAGRAGAQVLVTEIGTPYVSSAPTAAFGTTGALMNGIVVSAYFGDVVSSGVWGALNPNVSGVQTSDFVLFHPNFEFTGNGFTWSLRNLTADRPLTRLLLHGAPGNVVFDIELDPSNSTVGTPGSSGGLHFSFSGPLAGESTATYRNQVAIAGSPAVGDLWESVDVVLSTGLAPGTRVFFALDTDNLPASATLAPGTSVAPEPATLGLVATGLLAVALVGRGRRAQARG